MNVSEIEQLERQLRVNTRLPLSYAAWADIEQQARAHRSRVVGQVLSGFFAALSARFAGFVGQVRHTAADCTDARLHHS